MLRTRPELLGKALSDLENIFHAESWPLPVLDHFVRELSGCEGRIADFGMTIDTDFCNPKRLGQNI